MRKCLLILFLATVLLYVVAAGWGMQAYEEWNEMELVRYPSDVRPFVDFGPYVSSRQGGFMIVLGAILGIAWLTAVMVLDRCRAKKAGKQKNQNKTERLGSVLMQLEMNGSVGGERLLNRKLASGTIATLLLIGMLTLEFNIQSARASETTYIRADGSVDPLTAKIASADNITYTLASNVEDSIVVEKDNIVVDGAGYTLQGTGFGTGILLYDRSNVTIKNVEIKSFRHGLWLENNSKNNSIFANRITSNECGIRVSFSPNNSILRNNITSNKYGVFSYKSLNNSFAENQITENELGIKFYKSSKNDFIENRIAKNGIGGRFDSSHNNNFSGNNIALNYHGIYFQGIKIYGGCGIYFHHSSNNTIYRNNIVGNEDGVLLDNSPNNNVSMNNITGNQYGILLLYPSGENIVCGNNITNNSVGVKALSRQNKVYYNNFINNTEQVHHENSSFFEFNYWSDCTCQDRNGDDIGDTPYGDYLDLYPLMKPWSTGWSPERPVILFWMQWWFYAIVVVAIVELTGVLYYLKKRRLSGLGLFEGEKTVLFWVGLGILGFASTFLFFDGLWKVIFVRNWRYELQWIIPSIVSGLVFMLIGFYMMKSGVKEKKTK